MSYELWSVLLADMTAHSDEVRQIGLSVHGESGNHPLLRLFVLELRAVSPKWIITIFTNGDNLMKRKEAIPELFDAGLNAMTLDLYDENARKKWNEIKEDVERADVTIHDFYATGDHAYSNLSSRQKVLIVMDEVHPEFSSPVKTFNTQGSHVPFVEWTARGVLLDKFPVIKKCRELNKYLTIYSEGTVGICCADGARANSLGVFPKQSIQEIWKSDEANGVRYLLDRGRRDCIPSCYACDRKSMRDGLWPYSGPSFDVVKLAERLASEAVFTERLRENYRALHSEHPIANRFIREKLKLEIK